MRPAKKVSGKKGAKGLLFELDGDGVDTKTVNALLLLNLATSFFRLIVKLAETDKLGLTLNGLKVVSKCVAIATTPSDDDSARICSARAKRLISGSEVVPSGCETIVGELRSGIRSIPSGIRASVRLNGKPDRLTVPVALDAQSPWETIELRAVPMKVGGQGPTVELHSESESEPFTIKTGAEPSVALDNARRFGSLLRTEVDIAAIVCRDANGHITQGHITDLYEVHAGDPVAAWREWYAAECLWIDDEQDVGAALGRHH